MFSLPSVGVGHDDLISLNDDCLRYVMLCLSVPDAHSLSATSTILRSLLDDQTVAKLIFAEIPVAVDLLNRFPDRSAKSVYLSFKPKLECSQAPYTLEDFEFVVLLRGKYMECSAELIDSDTENNAHIKIALSPSLAFHISDVGACPKTELGEVDVLVTDRNTGNTVSLGGFVVDGALTAHYSTE